MIEIGTIELREKVRAIVQFGPATPTSGMRGGEYFEVVLDPNMLSPGGKYLRMDQSFQPTEIHGWQRVEALTVCEVLGKQGEYIKVPEGYKKDPNAVLVMKAIHG